MRTRVIHHTPYGFPMDPNFFGQTFVIGNHTRNTGLESAVSSASGSVSVDFEDLGTQQRLAHERFRTNLLSGGLHASLKEVRHLQVSERKAELERAATTAVSFDYFKKLLEWTNSERVAMAIHYFGAGFNGFEDLKSIFGDSVDVYLHLHCLADLFIGNLAKPQLNSRQEKQRTAVNRLIDRVNPYFIAVSDAVRDSFLQHGIIPEERISVVRNGVSSDLYHPVSEGEKAEFRRDLGVRASKLVGYVGRLSRVKGCDNLLYVLKHFEKNPSDVAFVIATSGGREMDRFVEEAKREVPQMIAEDKLKFCIDVSKFTSGFYSKDDFVNTAFYHELVDGKERERGLFVDVITKPIQPHLDVYLQPSNSEGLPLSVLEALMSGVPVVASSVGGVPGVVGHANGSLVQVRNRKRIQIARDFADALHYWKEHPQTKEYIETTRNHFIEAGYDAVSMARAFDSLYTKVKP